MTDFSHFDALRRFREVLVLESGRTYAQAQAPFQLARFEAWDLGRRVYCESCTGSSKTTDVAAWILSWLALVPGWEAAIYAVDTDQARKILLAAEGFLRRSPGLRSAYGLEVQRGKMLSAARQSSCIVDSSDVASAEGLLVDCVILEQLESWRKEELWETIFARVHKRDCKLIIVANACQSEDDWPWKIRDMACNSREAWTFIEIVASDVPWITATQLDEQKATLRSATFERLYFNRVGSADTSLWPPQIVDAMLTLEGPATERPPDIRRCIISIDLGLKHDLSALACVGEDLIGRQYLLNLAAWQGSQDKPVRVDDVQETALDWMRKYGAEALIYDPWQFQQAAQHLRAFGVVAKEFTFSRKSINDLANQLYRRGVDGMLALYPHAGPAIRDGSEWDLTREAKACKMVEDALGFKIETKGSGTKDRIIALGMASLWLTQNARMQPRSMTVDEFLKEME